MRGFIFGFFRVFKSIRLWILSMRGMSEKDLQYKKIKPEKPGTSFAII